MQALITAIHPAGLNLRLLEFFDGTLDKLHIQPLPEKSMKVGKKVKVRVLYNFCSTPPRFALSLASHVVKLSPKLIKHAESSIQTMEEAYPIGKIMEGVKVQSVEPERGLFAEVGPDLVGFVHVGTIPHCVFIPPIECSTDISHI